MTDTYHGMLSADILQYVPHFPSVSSGVLQTAVPISSGAITITDPSFGLSRWTNSWTYRLLTSEDKFFFCSFWMLHNGGCDGFWLPSWLNDFTITSDITSGDSFIDIEESSFKEYFDSFSTVQSDFSDPANPPTNQWGLMIMETDRTVHFRGIESVDATRINFWDPSGAGMPANLATSGIALISLVRYARFSTGELDISWITDNSKVDIPMAFTELLFEGVLA